MSWLAPLGFLGLLSIIALIVIYILKPNYQQKIISSTYVWKLSLKYKKKKIPISKLRNILLFLCQLLVLTACALILAKPVIEAEDPSLRTEKIVILDASASMLTETDDITRFERAVEEIIKLAEETIADNGYITVLMAAEEITTVVSAGPEDAIAGVKATLYDLIQPGQLKCTYGSANLDEAMVIAGDMLEENPNAKILLYTGTNYIETGIVEVINVAEETEWNAAILNCTASVVDNFYNFSVDVACYNRATSVEVIVKAYGCNTNGNTIEFSTTAFCGNDKVVTIVFDTAREEYGSLFSFEYVMVTFADSIDDSFQYDNQFYVYGGTKETIRVQYYSTIPNVFFSTMLGVLSDIKFSDWNVEIYEANEDTVATEGFDFYIFEHAMPEKMPIDGAVFLSDLNIVPSGLDVQIGEEKTSPTSLQLAGAEPHPVTAGFNAGNVTVTRWKPITSHAGFTELAYQGSQPVLLVKNTPAEKVAVMSFSVHASNLTVGFDFPVLLLNLFDYFFPSTLQKYDYEIGENVVINSRTDSIEIQGPGYVESFNEFPLDWSTAIPGQYEISQTLMSGKIARDSFYVRIAAEHSNIVREVDTLSSPEEREVPPPIDEDLWLYFAAVLVFCLFAEWLLQLQEQF